MMARAGKLSDVTLYLRMHSRCGIGDGPFHLKQATQVVLQFWTCQVRGSPRGLTCELEWCLFKNVSPDWGILSWFLYLFEAAKKL